MIEEPGTSGYDCNQTPAMEQGTVRRSRNSGDNDDITISGTGKRRRFGSQADDNNDFHLQYRSQHDFDVNFDENVVTTEVSGTSEHHHVSSVFISSINDDLISDLKAECVSETDNDGFSRYRETSTSSIVCLESEEMESLSTAVTLNNKKKTSTIEATSRRKPPSAAVTMPPSAAELEEFFSKAEKYEQKRFAEKYNFDIVKDVPMEGRYQWVPLKP